MRMDLKFKIKEIIAMKKSILLLGPKGIGKTHILKRLNGIYIEYPSAKQILQAIIKHYKLSNRKYSTIPEQMKLVKNHLHRTVLLLDNCSDIYKPTKKLIENLINQGAVVVAASRRKLYFCKAIIRIKELSKKEALELLKKILPYAKNMVYRIIINKSYCNPGKIIELSKEYNIGIKNVIFNPLNDKSIIRFFLKLRPQMPQRIDILPVWTMFLFGFGALTIKVLMYSQGDFKDAYIVAAFGYTSLIIYRILSPKQRRYK